MLDHHGADEFYWPAVAGLWAQFTGGGMPFSASPCGVVVEKNRSLMFHNVEQQFPAAAVATPRIEEILLAPFRVDGKPIGTVWAIVHSNAKRFDSEDRRLLESLARFAGATYQIAQSTRHLREAREQLSLVNHELGHRLRNVLAMVTALASQTLRDAGDKAAVRAFNDRIRALASAHDILIDQTWSAAPMRVITEKVFAALGESSRVTLDGAELTLGPRTGLALSLILHELGTNALKYGALSMRGGRVFCAWSISGDEDPLLEIRWREEGGPAVTEPDRLGFGSRLINMGLTGDGGVSLSYPVGGVEAVFTAPLRLTQGQDH